MDLPDPTCKNKRAMTKDEVGYLVDLVQIYPIITSKETNAGTNKKKDIAWVSLTAAFNAKSGSIPRNKDQLKAKWDNLKKAARKRSQQMRMNNLKTGGGEDFITPDDILDKVAGFLGSTCTGFEVPFVGDGTNGGGSETVFDIKNNLNDLLLFFNNK
ncbi:hypothetical protein ABMA28_003507 [Loxostege sticticalis]|uniref:Regulatory protein zeste n=1 Tax=Loxostege sticticalis TaxID=481309 RepID=A0ABD0SWB6_LOXSC